MEQVELKTIQINIDGVELGFPLVQRLAEKLASELIDEPMLIAWFDG